MFRKALLGNVTDNDLRLLRVFRAVVACGGFAAAELELNIARSTISRHIKDLETRVGFTLCRRGRGGFALTGEGEQLYRATESLLSAVEDFRHEVNDLNQQLTGTVALALFDKTVSNPACHIHRALAAFSDAAPNAHLQLHVAPINSIEQGVMEGRFHLGIIPDHRPSSSLHYHPLFREQMYLYCGADHPLFGIEQARVDPDSIRRCRHVGIGYHSPNMEVTRQTGQRRDATAWDQEAVAHLILSGRYTGYLPDHYAHAFVESGSMRALRPDLFQYVCQFSAILRRAPPPSRVVERLLKALLEAHPGTRD